MAGQTDQGTYSVAEVAEKLNITKDAVRKRITRGTLEAEKVDGEWTISLDDGVQPKTEDKTEGDSHFWKLIQDQKLEIERLQQELERKEKQLEQKEENLGSTLRILERVQLQLEAPKQKPVARWWNRFFRQDRK